MLKRPVATGIVFFLLFLFLLEWWFPDWWGRTLPEKGENLEMDSEIQVLGTVSALSVQEKFKKKEMILHLEDVYLLSHSLSGRKSQRMTTSHQSIICYLSYEEQLKIGNQVILRGKYAPFASASNPGEFDQKTYYWNRDVLFAIKEATVEKKSEKYAVVGERLQEIKEQCRECFKHYLRKEDASLMNALILGEKGQLDQETKWLYQKSGIAHILSISGLHISLLGLCLFSFFRLLGVPLWLNSGCCITLLFLYGKMIGSSSSASRAIIMFTLILLAKVWKRSPDLFTSLSLAALLLLLEHPLLLKDCSFLLSFSAMLGIGWLYPAWKKIGKIESKIGDAMGSSLAVLLATAPILIRFFHEISFYAIFLNLLVLPFLTLLLGTGVLILILDALKNIFLPAFLGGGLSCVLSLLGLVIHGILSWYHFVCELVLKIPFGRWNVATPSYYKVGIYYGLLFLTTILVNKKRAKGKLFVILLSLTLLFIPPKPEFAVWNLDVGQGDCSVIFTKTGKTYLIDGGSHSKYQVGERIIIPFLKSQGCNQIDGIFISHFDTDHINGIKELLAVGKRERLPVKKLFFYTGQREEGLQKLFGESSREAGLGETEIFELAAGDCVKEGEIQFFCLYPDRKQKYLAGNDASLVLRVETESFRGLFVGDLERKGEENLLRKWRGQSASVLCCDYLKVGHHGSQTSSSLPFLKQLQPKVMVVSCGRDNPYGHPHREALGRLESTGGKTYRTDQLGAIQTGFKDGRLHTEGFFGYRKDVPQ